LYQTWNGSLGKSLSEPLLCRLQTTGVDGLIAEDASPAVPSHLHRNPLWNSGPNQVAHGAHAWRFELCASGRL
jgi:hypothetical protein